MTLLIESELQEIEPDRVMARDLCVVASWFHLAGEVEKRDVAIDLIADLLAGDPVMSS